MMLEKPQVRKLPFRYETMSFSYIKMQRKTFSTVVPLVTFRAFVSALRLISS